jgi:cell division protein FtsW
MGLVLLLIMLEPDMGTAGIILFEALVVYFLSGSSVHQFGFVLPVLFIGGFILIKLSPYRAARLTAFLSGDSFNNASYHVRQILISLGMGGVTGVGLGNSVQKYAYLPENTTDSIFAIIAEELGLIGGILLIVLFIILSWRGFIIASRAKDQFGRLLAAAIISFISIQTLINLGAQTALIPLTGVPLPFISYGGSSLVVDMCSIGILLNIAKQSKK